jgi:BNR repeat-like domain
MSIRAAAAVLALALPALAVRDPNKPTWWDKFQYLSTHAPSASPGGGSSVVSGPNVDVSNECGPQSETFIAIDPTRPRRLAAGSNEIFRDPMRGYFSTDGGATWGGVDLPLPPCKNQNGTCFGSDPSLAFDSRGALYYSYIVVFFGNGNGVSATEMAVARSNDGGRTYPQVTFFAFEGGSNHFNDKPMITADQNATSPFRDNVYVAWDSAVGGSGTGGMHVATSSDGGATFTIARVDGPSGQAKSIGATITTGPQGQVYVAWNDIQQNAIVFNSSLDGGATWGTPRVISPKQIAFDIGIPAESFRGALVYPACDVDRSAGPRSGRITCSWMDFASDGVHTDLYASVSDDGGASWSARLTIAESLPRVDRFNHWLATDPVTGQVNVSYYDTRNDTTGSGFMTDVYLSQSADGKSFGPSFRVTDVSSNEHDCNGTFPCDSINYGNQQGDYEGVAAYGGVVHPIWTDSRRNQTPGPTCPVRGLMEEVFTATVK